MPKVTPFNLQFGAPVPRGQDEIVTVSEATLSCSSLQPPLWLALIASVSATIIEVISISAAGKYPVQSSTVDMSSVCGCQAQQRRKFSA
ncbi:hypothetical protein BJX68DRAFT_236427 [Aspergillus pseudodeflectus]|uniref:Uncharacterized protein n=1 Tax=Aspergillus pseudodeflectus TaxID=176178 RepID=A0ABR4KF66_9EURO